MACAERQPSEAESQAVAGGGDDTGDTGDTGELAPGIQVEVVFCAGRAQVDVTRLRVPAGATVADAVAASGLRDRHAGLADDEAGVWGRIVPVTRALREGDRVELYRPLLVAPMEARRTRQRQQDRGRKGRPAARSRLD